jgi:type I restriction enzyme S subunit
MKAYEAYRESGVEWVGSVPVGWSVIALKRDLRFLTSGSRGWADHYADEGALFLRIGNLTRDGLDLDLADIQRVAVPAGAEGERTRVEPGDVLFSITAFMGSVAVVPANLECAYVSQHVALARLRGDLLLPRWVGYATLSAAGKAHLDAQCYGGTKIQLSLDDVANLPVAVPSLAEQIAITTFLDQETGKIDALVAEQERLIALLKEKRQAVISQAVTKGLNPNAPMKDSGIEWLGQVPAHWHICQLKRSFRSVDYGISDALSLEGSTIVLRMNNIQNGAVSFEDVKYTESVDENLILESGDLLYNRTNSLDLIGKVGVYEEQSEKPVSFASYLVRFRLREGLPRYFSFLLNTNELLGVVRSNAYVAIGQCNLNPTKYGEIAVAVPPPQEQAYITNFLNAQVTAIDTLITEATQAITLLRERRAALISAAVTGKIDVRSLALTKQEAA